MCEEISTEKCEDNDGDGFYGLDPECINGQDCDDTPGSGHIIRPGQPENCETPDDDNCDTRINCEDPSCHEDTSCDNECDKDGDGYYSMDCGGPDCKDNPESEPNAANIYPGHDQENTEDLCDDGDNNDCDDEIDCVVRTDETGTISPGPEKKYCRISEADTTNARTITEILARNWTVRNAFFIGENSGRND